MAVHPRPQLSETARVTLPPRDEAVVLDAAMAAPSMHNTQPWRFTTGPGWIDIAADPTRMLPAEDPDGRMAAVAVGAAVFNARVALHHLGYAEQPEITARWPRLACRLTITGRRTSESWDALYSVITVRRTNRYPFRDEPLPTALADELRQAARQRGADLMQVTDDLTRQRLTALIHAADAADREDNAREVERMRWVGPDPAAGRAEGLTYEAAGPVAAAGTPFRDLAPDLDLPDRPALDFEAAPVMAVLHTRGDDPADWLRAGQALEHVLLLGTVRGVAFSFTNQPLEHTALRAAVAEALGSVGHPQALLRMGFPTTAVQPTPRRSATDATAR